MENSKNCIEFSSAGYNACNLNRFLIKLERSRSDRMKKNESKFLLYIVGGFVVAFVGLVLALVIYNGANPSLSYKDMEQLDSFVDTYNQEEDVYLVYFYSETCPACQDIKREVLAFADNNNYDVPVYFVDLARVSFPANRDEILTGYRGTPHMEIVLNGNYIGFYASGSVQIPNLLDEINSGQNEVIN
jgi:thiol-disulfide isomerase/thioredoxin